MHNKCICAKIKWYEQRKRGTKQMNAFKINLKSELKPARVLATDK
jgi:hypothetical protein